ncbi:MAG: Glutamyl-tRNA(Gln) amidotransferase subunit A [Parcubacteria group bacterium GW2011_GWA2_51_10]|nr:MAG: Glutamyl-tRNA(Gln) amidotransferase subunit A [Parcubacteria group bacterium GW2011_GWA2_51_10]
MLDITALTIAGARKGLDKKEYSAQELTNACLSEIEKREPNIHAFLEVWMDSARDEAKAADEMIARGESRSLTGIPLAIKDNILIEGRRASSGSKILENYEASYNATVIEKLKREGAVFIGRTNMDEFAMGSSTENSAFGPTKNPHDTARVPGGSSGGSAAAVACGAALGALGSDTGGSIRQPAAFCGLVGLKPTYGSVSRFGLMAMGSSLDQIGPFAKTVADAEIIFEAIKGHDPLDSTSFPSEEEASPPQRKVIGVLRSFIERGGIDPEMLANFNSALEQLKSRGFTVKEVELPSLEYALAVYYVLMPAEASTNLARYDGIRYGLSTPAETIQEVYKKTRGQGFGREVRSQSMR